MMWPIFYSALAIFMHVANGAPGRTRLDILCSLTASMGRAASLCFMAERNCCFAANRAAFISTALGSPLIGAMLWKEMDGSRRAQVAGHVKVKLVCPASEVAGGVDQVPAKVGGAGWRRETSRSLVVRFVPLPVRCGYWTLAATSNTLFPLYGVSSRVRLNEEQSE